MVANRFNSAHNDCNIDNHSSENLMKEKYNELCVFICFKRVLNMKFLFLYKILCIFMGIYLLQKMKNISKIIIVCLLYY